MFGAGLIVTSPLSFAVTVGTSGFLSITLNLTLTVDVLPSG